MKVTVLMGREPSYTRNKVILDALKAAGVELTDFTDSSGNYPVRFVKSLAKYFTHSTRDADAILIGFFGQPIVPVVSRFTGKPLILDAFLSGYDTMCFDRKRFPPDSLRGRFFFHLDKSACEKADLVLLDTNEHIDFFVNTFGLPREKFRRLFVGAETSVFYPRPQRKSDERFNVFYYCTFHPVHGTEFVIKAANLLRDSRDIRFTIVGASRKQVENDGSMPSPNTDNLDFISWIDYEKLPESIAAADVCLGGHFSQIEKASRVIPGKVFQFLSMGKPTIAGDNPANRELLTHLENAFLVTMGDDRAIADAVLELRSDPELKDRIAGEGYRTFNEHCTPEILGRELAGYFVDVVKK